MVVEISKKEIFDEVEKRSSLEGSVLPERFEGVWASKEEGVFLDSFWMEGYTAIVQLMKRYLKSSTVSYKLDQYDKDEVLTIEAEMPARYNSLLDGSVSTDVKMLIACNVLHGWLEVKAPESAAKYDEEAKGYTEDLRVKLLYRTAPEDRGKLANKSCYDGKSIYPEDRGKLANKSCYDGKSIYPEWEYLNNAKKDCERIPPQWQRCGQRETVEVNKNDCCGCEDKHPFGFDACR